MFGKGLINNLAALVIAPITLLIGIQIGRFFQSPRPEIKSVNAVRIFTNGPYYLEKHIAAELRGNQQFLSRLQHFLPDDDVKYINWMDGNEPLEAEFVYRIRVKLAELLSQLTAEKESLSYNVNQLNHYVPGGPLPDLIPTGQVEISSIEQMAQIQALNPKSKGHFDIPGKFQSALRTTKTELTLCSELLNFIDLVNSYFNDNSKSKFTGSVVFEVGVLNKGESDAVIYKDGSYLAFEDERIPVSLDSFYVIKSHSFRLVTYSIDSSNKKNSASLTRWNFSVKNSPSQVFYNILSNIDGKIYHQDSSAHLIEQ